jgi:hypothetical protein
LSLDELDLAMNRIEASSALRQTDQVLKESLARRPSFRFNLLPMDPARPAALGEELESNFAWACLVALGGMRS